MLSQAWEQSLLAQPTGPCDEIFALVEQLGADQYQQRELAYRRLLRMGTKAKKQLEKGLNSPIAEVRQKSAVLLASVRQQAFRQQLKALLDEPKNENIELPGWKRFRQIAGESRQARELFVEMQRTQHALLEAYEQGPDQAAEAFHGLVASYSNGQTILSLGSAATLLLVAGDERVDLTEPRAYSDWIRLVPSRASELFIALYAEEEDGPLRKLLVQWLGQPRGNRPEDESSRRLYRARDFGLHKEGLALAIDIVEHHLDEWLTWNGSEGMSRIEILNAIGRWGNEAHIDLIEPLLDMPAVYNCQLGSTQEQRNKHNKLLRRIGEENLCVEWKELRLQDVVLALLVHLSDQELSDYGMNIVFHSDRGFCDRGAYNSGNLDGGHIKSVFATTEDRERALAKWRIWSESNRKSQ